ncbi:hypothetical protein [Streptomyces chrestomyceticus]|uniref:Integral membrane protein n=1 Tax=Streptomyces chrestomyceticus TaxID=68185 RepID=A0ABU7WUC8_9ACTN
MLTSTLSETQWWVAAIVSGFALAVAAQSMATTARDKLIAASLPLAGAIAIGLSSAAHGYTDTLPLLLYTTTMIILVILRLLFAKYINRQLALKRSGKPMENLSGKQTAIFLLAFMTTLVLVSFAI